IGVLLSSLSGIIDVVRWCQRLVLPHRRLLALVSFHWCCHIGVGSLVLSLAVVIRRLLVSVLG
ncbi:14113_t:CDS:1, partial [Cetraspora pellucida]